MGGWAATSTPVAIGCFPKKKNVRLKVAQVPHGKGAVVRAGDHQVRRDAVPRDDVDVGGVRLDRERGPAALARVPDLDGLVHRARREHVLLDRAERAMKSRERDQERARDKGGVIGGGNGGWGWAEGKGGGKGRRGRVVGEAVRPPFKMRRRMGRGEQGAPPLQVFHGGGVALVGLADRPCPRGVVAVPQVDVFVAVSGQKP